MGLLSAWRPEFYLLNDQPSTFYWWPLMFMTGFHFQKGFENKSSIACPAISNTYTVVEVHASYCSTEQLMALVGITVQTSSAT